MSEQDFQNEEFLVVEEEREPDYHALIPRCVIRMKLPHAAFKLYCYYKDICWNDKDKCYKSLETVKAEAHMDGRTVISARDRLVHEGLIRIDEKIRKDGSKVVIVTVVNIRQKNIEYCQNSTNKTTSERESPHTKLQAGEYKTTSERLQNYKRKENTSLRNNNSEEKHTLSPPAASRRDGDGACVSSPSKSSKNGSNGFHIKEIPQPEKDYARQAAEKLHDALVKKRKLMRRANLNQWAEQIRQCLNTNLAGFDEGEFEETLNWYCEHIGDDYVKDARSAESFCDSLPSIYQSMKRSSNGKGSRIQSTIERYRNRVKSGS